MLRVLKRNRVTSDELISVYIPLLRLVFAYCAPPWYSVIPERLSKELERVQKPANRILYLESRYNEALSLSGCSLVGERHFHLSIKTFRERQHDR